MLLFGHTVENGKLKCLWYLLLGVIASWAMPSMVFAQSPDSFDGHPELYHADLTQYFPSPQAEGDARRSLAATTESYLHTAPWAPDSAAARLEEGGKLLTEWMRHNIYCKACYSREISNKLARECESDASDRFDAVLAFVKTQLQSKAIQALSNPEISRFGLERYRFLLEQARADAAHTLSADAQRSAELLANPLLEGLNDRYDSTVRNLKANSIDTPGGKLDPIKDAAVIARNPERAIRQAGFEDRQQAYIAHGEVFAATLIDTARIETALAKLNGYASAPERMYAHRLQQTEPQVRAMLDTITQHAEVLKDYQRVRAEQVSRVTGIRDVDSWDMGLSSGYDPKPLTFAEARTAILKALVLLGPEYTAQFRWLLDPSNGALEIAGGPNRARGGFSLGYSQTPVMLYMSGFDGSLSSTATAIHEGGHAIHRKLMKEVTPYYFDGPHFLSEAYAIFNELLFWDEMERESSTPAEKVYFRERFLDKVSLEVFTSAEEGALEQGIYDGVASGKINNQNDLDDLNGHILDQYELFARKEPILRSGWMKKSLLVEDPLYLINYLYASLVACKLYEMEKTNPADFQNRYISLLQEGFDAPAEELLKKNMGFTLDSNQLLDGALQLMRERTALLKQSYQALPR